MGRTAEVTRDTGGTRIVVRLGLDGTGEGSIRTGIGFFDHMLSCFSKHGFFDLDLTVGGDLHTGSYHTVRDTGIVLGMALRDALGDKASIRRYGAMILPVDEALVSTAVDLSGRPYFSWGAGLTADRLGTLEAEAAEEFFYAVSWAGEFNLHIRQLAGKNSHHILEAVFKSFAKAMDQAVSKDERIQGVLSTKGSL